MAVYTFKNLETDEITTEIMPIGQLDDFKKNNPHLQQQIVSAPGIGDPVRLGRVKPSQDFRDILKRIKKGSGRDNTIETFVLAGLMISSSLSLLF